MDRFGPSVLVEAGGEKLLFDVGRGASQRLWSRGVALSQISAVFFTHLHSDHLVGFPDVWLTGSLPNTTFAHRTVAMRVFGPTGITALMGHLSAAFEADIRIRQADENVPAAASAIEATDITEGVVYEHNGVKVTAFDVDHGELIKPAMGYRVDFGGHSIVLSGDTRVSENLVKYATGVDVLFHEVASARPEQMARSEAARRIIGHHVTPTEAAGIFARTKPRLAVYQHIVLLTTDPKGLPPTIEDVIRDTRASYKGPFQVGADLMSFDIGSTITIRPTGATAPRVVR